MKNTSDIRTGDFNIYVHLVFVTKYRCGVFSKVMLDLKNIFSKVCKDFEAELIEFDG